MSNLEPIEEKDIDLEAKFGKVEESREIKEAKGARENEGSVEKEAAPEIVSAEKDSAYSKILSKVKTAPDGDTKHEDVKLDAEKVYEKQDAESQIQHLIDIASNKGIIHAVKVAKHLEDNYVLDMFHDKLLSDELHDALVKKGIIEDI